MDWKKIKGLKEERGAVLTKMEAIVNKSEEAKRAMNDDEGKEFGILKKESDNLRGRIEALETIGEAKEGVDLSQRHITRALTQGDIQVADGSAGFSFNELRKYSLVAAIRSKADGNFSGFEAEVSQEIAKRSGGNPQGFYIPAGLPMLQKRYSQRALDSATAAPGLVETIVDYADFIDVLRSALVFNKLGAMYLGNLVGKIQIPQLTAAATGYWVTEGTAVTESDQAVGQVTLTAHTVGGFTDITRLTLKQTSFDVEMMVRNDLVQVLARAIELGAINGTGSSGQPTGILQNSSVATLAIGTNGGNPTWPNILSHETTVTGNNAVMASPGYLTNPKMRGTLKQVAKIGSTFPTFIWGDDNEVNNYPTAVTTQVPSNLTKGSSSGVCSAMIFGDWRDLIIALWGSVDILVDPFSNSSNGSVRVRALQEADVELRHTGSFTKTVDYTTL